MKAAVVLLATASCVLTSCAGINSNKRSVFAGGSILAQGYKIDEDLNTDTSIASGHLRNTRSDLQIAYSIFTQDLVLAEPNNLSRTGHEVIWSKRSFAHGAMKVTTLAKDRILKERKLYISFPNGGPANFIAAVNSDEEVAEVERIVATFEAKYSKGGESSPTPR